MTSQSLRSWLVPSAYSPLNVAIARYAPALAIIEWLAILAVVLELIPATDPKIPLNPYVVGVCCTILLLIGIRGLRVGHIRRIGSLILITTNACVLFLYFLPVGHFWKLGLREISTA